MRAEALPQGPGLASNRRTTFPFRRRPRGDPRRGQALGVTHNFRFSAELPGTFAAGDALCSWPAPRRGHLVCERVGETGWTGGGLSGSTASAVGLNGRLPRAGLRPVDRECPWAALRDPGQHVTQRPQTCAVACEPTPCPARPGGRSVGEEKRVSGHRGPRRPARRANAADDFAACEPRCQEGLAPNGRTIREPSSRTRSVLAGDDALRSVRSARGCRGPRWPEARSLLQTTSGRPDPRGPQQARAQRGQPTSIRAPHQRPPQGATVIRRGLVRLQGGISGMQIENESCG